jgi:hypothetical protein
MKPYHDETHHAGMRVRLAWAERDAKRSTELDYVVKVLCVCKVCGSQLSHNSYTHHPGVCGKRKCKRLAR